MLKRVWWKVVKAVAPQFEKENIIPPALFKAIAFFLQCPKATRYEPGLPADIPWTTLVMIVAEHYLSYQTKQIDIEHLHECAEHATFALVLSVCELAPPRLSRDQFGKILGEDAATDLVPKKQLGSVDKTDPGHAAKWLQKYLWLVKPDISRSSSRATADLPARLPASQKAGPSGAGRVKATNSQAPVGPKAGASSSRTFVKRERDDDNDNDRPRKQARTQKKQDRSEDETLEAKQQRLRFELENVDQLIKHSKREKELLNRIEVLEGRQ